MKLRFALMDRHTLALLPAWIFLFVLPFTHTVALRLAALFFATLAAAWSLVRTPGLRIRYVPAGPLIALWAALPLVLLPFSIEVRYSLNEFKAEVGYGLLVLMVFFLSVRNELALQNALRVIVAAFFGLTFWAIGSWLRGGIWQEEAYFGGSASFSYYLATVAPMFVLVWYARPFGEATRAVVCLSVFLTLLTGFLTEQRAFWFAAGVQVAAIFAMRPRDSWTRRATGATAMGAAAFVILAAGAFAAAIVTRYGYHTSASEVIADDLRLRYWPTVLDWIATAPFTGHGFGRAIMMKAYPEEVGLMGIFWHAHNVVLNYGIQLGVGGVVAIVGVFVGLLLHWLRLRSHADPLVRAAAVAGVLLVIGVFTRNMTNDMFQRDLALLFWSLTGILGGIVAHRTRPPQ